MLQINTGKLYTRGVGRTNALTGVLYTNANVGWHRRVDTAAGSFRSVGADQHDHACVFDIEERIEAQEEGPGVLVSHGVGPFLDDFAVVATFAMGAIFARRAETVKALTGEEVRASSLDWPGAFIARIYDKSVYISDEEAEAFTSFVETLLGLERRSYLGAMRAMRTFVSGLHRLADDPALTYTLMVSAVESLAQDFDGYVPTWEDVEGQKRKDLDKALSDADAPIQDGVRNVLLKHEHLALARRYRAFIVARVDDSYFRQDCGPGGRPLARWELEPAVRQAYAIRSAYVHQLRALPTMLGMAMGHWETATVDRRPALTLQGLYRLTRHVIQTFIAEQPRVAAEPYNYRDEEAGIVSLPMAAQYWIWRPLNASSEALRRLEGLLEITASQLLADPSALYPDMRPALADVERLLGQAPRADQPALLSLHVLYNFRIAPDYRTPELDAFLEKHGEEANVAGAHSIVVGTVLEATDDWSVEEHQKALDDYFAQRGRPQGLHAPRVLEAAACLDLAEKYRLAGDALNARSTIARGVEAHPGVAKLRDLEVGFDPQIPIVWQDVLLPQKDTAEAGADASTT